MTNKLNVGLLLIPSNPRGGNYADRMDECIDHAISAESVGFDFCMVPEHHQDKGFLPQLMLPAAAIAARTKRIRVGTAISIAALKHPMQVVEEFFTLDHMSRGRMIAGVGVGYQPQDFSMFGLDVKDRVTLSEDALRALDMAKKSDFIEKFEGNHYNFENVKIMPGPFQDNLPVALGTWSHTGARLAGRTCDGIFIDQNTSQERGLKLIASFSKAAEEANRPSKPSILILNRYCAVADTREEARAILEPHVMKTKRYYYRNNAKDPAKGYNEAKSAEDLVFEDFEHEFVWGTPDDCIAKLKDWQQNVGVNHVMLLPRTASGPTHDVVSDQIMRFGRDVIPALS